MAASNALPSGTRLRGGIRLVRRDALEGDTLDRLQSAGVTQPVFRQEGATVVALPEVRVEDDSEAKLAEVRKIVADKARPITAGPAGPLTLHVLSDDGRDALALANELVERHKLTSVTPRFLRIVSGPAVRT